MFLESFMDIKYSEKGIIYEILVFYYIVSRYIGVSITTQRDTKTGSKILKN